MTLDQLINASRRALTRSESEGRVAERDWEQARLQGLLDARRIVGGQDDACLHPVHKTAGLDENGRTIWLCMDCGAQA